MASPTYRSGDYRLDPAGRELWRSDKEVVLRRKVFDVVAYLVEHHDRAVEHKELFTAVWGEVGLSERTLPQAVLEARRALEDSADDPRYIKTVPGYGYHWIAPVEIEQPPPEPATHEPQSTPAAPHPLPRPRRPLWPWLTAALLAAAALAGAAIYHLRNGPAPHPDPAAPMAEGEIALLLPVTVEPQDHPAWIRLGAMEHIADRIRAAGQPMVPSDNVIALARNLSPQPTPEELDILTATTGARLVLAAHAEAERDRWRVSLRSLAGSQPPLTARGEAEDVLEAARAAADHLALSLGRTPAPEPDAEPGLALLVHRVNAATQAQQPDMARELIEAADPELQTHPRIRYLLARLDYYSGHDLDSAQAAFETLLQEMSAEEDTVLRGDLLNALGVVHYARGDYDTTEKYFGEAANLFDQANRLDKVGLLRNNMGAMANNRGDLDTAAAHLAHARAPLESTGHVSVLANLDLNIGVLAALRERWGDALAFFESSADRHAALHNLGDELRARINTIDAHVNLLDPSAALAVEPRLRELLSETENPSITGYAQVTRAHLLFTLGRWSAAERLLTESLELTESRTDLQETRLAALVLRTDHAARKGEWVRAADGASEILEQLPPDNALMAEALGRTWLTRIRAELALGRNAAAARDTSELHEWAERTRLQVGKTYAALARAELAAAEGRTDAAREAFEHALALADTGHAPLRLLQVASAYVPWLLAETPEKTSDPERATLVAARLARYAERDYGAALLQLRLAHATAPAAAWRAALRRVRALAGERQIPPELLVVPEAPPDPVKG